MLHLAFVWSGIVAAAMVNTGVDADAPCASQFCGFIPLERQEEAVRDLIARTVPEYRQLFRVHGVMRCAHSHQAAACFEVHVADGLVHIQGTSGARYKCPCSRLAPDMPAGIMSQSMPSPPVESHVVQSLPIKFFWANLSELPGANCLHESSFVRQCEACTMCNDFC